MSDLKPIAEIIVKDPKFINEIKESINNMMKDGKIDIMDVPDMIKLIVLGYNKLDKIKVTQDELPDLLKEIAHLIIVNYKLLPDAMLIKFEKILDTCISLIILVPNIRSVSCFC